MQNSVIRSVSYLFVLSLPLLACSLPSTAVAQKELRQAPEISDQPFSSDELAIYHEVLNGWLDDGKHSVRLSVVTVPLKAEASQCDKEIPFIKGNPNLLHRFREEDLSKLGSTQIHLVDPDAQHKEIEKNDPGKSIREGKSIEEAVNNGFAHGMVTLSEIWFDEKHEKAVVWYGFRCGGLCGNGGTVILEKKQGKWVRRKPCSFWIS